MENVLSGAVDFVKDFGVYPKSSGQPLDGFKQDKIFTLKRSLWIGRK